MLSNYLKTALRSLLRHRFFSFINVFGLAVAMALSMCIIMLVADQMMYDRYNTNRDRVYRINSVAFGKTGERFSETSTTTLALRQELTENFTGVEKAVRFLRGFGNIWLELEMAQNVNIPLSGYFADPEVLEIFQYEMEYGDPATALLEPFSVVLTKKAAKKLFREENPVGQTFMVGVEGPYKVTGVLKETKNKTHVAFEALASMATAKSLSASHTFNKDIDGSTPYRNLDNWFDYNSGWVYILVEKEKTITDIESQLAEIEKKHYSNITNPDTQRRITFIPQNLMDITPGHTINNSIGPVLPWFFVYFFMGLAGVVMLTSCFNFTNLSIARSLTRAREIGVRKVTGAVRSQIFLQFLSESILVALFALAFAIALLVVLRPLMLQLSFARMLRWDLQANFAVYAIFLVFAIVVGILAGFFPAVVLSGFQPVKVLKSLHTMKLFSNIGLRKTLLTAQFAFSLVFILSVIVVFNQLQLFLRQDHGFNMDRKIILNLGNAAPDALKVELLKNSNIQNVSAASHIPAAGFTFSEGFKKSLEEKEWTSLNYFAVDENYLDNIDIHLKTGKFFPYTGGSSNKNFIVLNEAAVDAFHFSSPDEAVGQEIIFEKDSSRKLIIGVVKNYNHQILMEKLEPMALMYSPDEFRILQIKYNGSFEEAGETVEAAWARTNPSMKVDYKDFYTEVHKMYDVFFGDLVNVLTVIAALAVLISCMGLLGMATYTTETRIKEISIRKVLGSSNAALVYLLSKGFVFILLMAVALAVPAAYFLNMLWLEQLAYHVTVDAPTIFTGVLALLIFGFVTVGSQTWRATIVNPVENLKND